MFLRVVLIALAAVVALAALGWLLLGRYVEYTDSGVRLNLPWRQEEAPTGAMPSDPLVVVSAEPTPTPEPTAHLAALSPIEAITVPVSGLSDGSAVQTVKQAGGNALVVEMKRASGKLAWKSGSQLAADLGVNAADDAAALEIGRIAREEDVYLVARISCFRDLALVNAEIGGPLMTKGGNMWYDGQGLRWVSPVSEQVTDYLTELCVELVTMGFDEILLDCSGFPHFGETHVLATDEQRPEDLTAPVEAFYQKIRGALADSGVYLSVMAADSSVTGAEPYSGLTPALLAEYADRIWCSDAEGVCASALGQAGVENLSARLVRLGRTQGEDSWSDLSYPYH